jgi:type IV secretion system protein VirB10
VKLRLMVLLVLFLGLGTPHWVATQAWANPSTPKRATVPANPYRKPAASSTPAQRVVTPAPTQQQQPAFSQQQSYPAMERNSWGAAPPLQGRVVTAPPGTFLNASLQTPISSETARVGDRFMATLGNDIAAGGAVVLPAGTQLEAQVVSVTKAGRAGRNGELDVRFTAAMLPTGQRVPLSAKIQTQDGSGVIKGGTSAGRLGKAALRTGVGAGLGAALGTAMGPLSGGRVGRGAIYGTALGSGLGAASAAWQKGEEALLPAGQGLNVVLDQPLTLTPGAPNNWQGGGYSSPGGGYYPPQSPPAGGYYGNGNGGGYPNYNNGSSSNDLPPIQGY